MKTLILVCTLALGFTQAGFAATYELMQSIPEETQLAHPKLSYAKDRWVDLIKNANQSIDIAQFYVSSKKNSALERVISELEKAAQRGVKIRFMISNELAGEYSQTVGQIRKIKGVDFRIYDISSISGGILHAKYWIFDNSQAFIGSQNFDWRALTQIHELGLLTSERSIVDPLREIFKIDWEIAKTGKKPQISKFKFAKNPSAFLVSSPPSLTPEGIDNAEKALLQLIGSAKKRVRVQLLSYHPVVSRTKEYWPVIDQALRQASVRGVKVELLVSHWNMSSPRFEHLKSLDVLPQFDVKIAEIPEHSTGYVPFSRVIHSKYVTVDDQQLWMGTSNWGKDYFRNSRNLEIVLKNPGLTNTVDEVFAKLWNSQYSKSISLLQKRARVRR